MKHITLNIGTEIRGDGLPLTDNERLAGMKGVEAAALNLFGGLTVTPTWGGWRNPAGETVTEEGIQVDILTDRPEAEASARNLAAQAKALLQQQSVLLQIRDTTAEFV